MIEPPEEYPLQGEPEFSELDEDETDRAIGKWVAYVLAGLVILLIVAILISCSAAAIVATWREVL